MHSMPKHVAIVLRTASGMYAASCSCRWEGSEWISHALATESKDCHLKEAMRPDPSMQWDYWLNEAALPEESR